jgi:hypothetical protein
MIHQAMQGEQGVNFSAPNVNPLSIIQQAQMPLNHLNSEIPATLSESSDLA